VPAEISAAVPPQLKPPWFPVRAVTGKLKIGPRAVVFEVEPRVNVNSKLTNVWIWQYLPVRVPFPKVQPETVGV
jgi:hypothetical protein